MSQAIWNTIIPSTTSGNQLATLLNGFKDAVVSGFSGTSRPSQLQAGGYWVDTTELITDIWYLNFYDGTQDILMGTIDKANGTFSTGGATTSFEILKISADAVGPALRLKKERIAGNGQVLISDSIGELHFVGTQDDGIEVIQAKMKAISLNNDTVSAAGAYLSWEAIPTGTAALVEMMRLKDSKLGVGTISPSETIESAGNIKANRSTADAIGVKLITHKKRIASGGQVLNNDVVFHLSINSHTDADAEVEVATIKATAIQNHTATLQGTKLEIQRTKTGAAVLSTAITIDDTLVTIADGMSVSGATTLAAVSVTGIITVVDGNFKIIGSVDPTKIASFEVDGFTTGVTRVFTLPNATTTLVATDVGQTLTTKIYAESQATDSTTTGANASLAAITSGVYRLTNASLTSLANIPAGAVSQNITLENRTGNTFTIIDSSAAVGTAANRIFTGSNGPIAIANNASVLLKYDSTSARWQIIGGSGSGSGGGSSLIWKRSTAPAPVVEQVDGFEFNSFDNVSNQEVYATIIVPSTYNAGSPIKLKSGKFFCSSTTGKVLFQTISALVSVLGTYTNTNTSTNTEVTVQGVSNTKNDIGTIDITTSTGQINAVSVAAGDIIRIKLLRNNASESSSAANDARLLLDSFELTFS